MKTGIQLITEERQEQIEKHGRSIPNDVRDNADMQLSFGAALLLCPDPTAMGFDPNSTSGKPKDWDKVIWNKMMSKSYKKRLIIAGALIAAEIDRIQAID